MCEFTTSSLVAGSWAQPLAHTESGGPWTSTVQGEREEKRERKTA